ncbi:hypothetical protein BgiBS90_028967, partial [Biomphalaria glabrata]
LVETVMAAPTTSTSTKATPTSSSSQKTSSTSIIITSSTLSSSQRTSPTSGRTTSSTVSTRSTTSKTSTSSSRPSNVTTSRTTAWTVSVHTTQSTRPNASSLQPSTASVLTATSNLSILLTEPTLKDNITSPPCFPQDSPLNCSFPINDKQVQSNETNLIIGLTIALCLSAISILMIVCFVRRLRAQRNVRRRVKNNSDIFNQSEKDTRSSVYCNSFIKRDVITPVLNSSTDLKSVPLKKVDTASIIYSQVSKKTLDHKGSDDNFNVCSEIYTEAAPDGADTKLSGTYYVLEQDTNYTDGEYINSNSIQKESSSTDKEKGRVNINQEYINSESLKKEISLVHREKEINTALYKKIHKEENLLAIENSRLADDRNGKSLLQIVMADPRYWNQTGTDDIERSSVILDSEEKNERKYPEIHVTEDYYINVQHDKSAATPDNSVLNSVLKTRDTYANGKLFQKDLAQMDHSNDGSQCESGSRNASDNYAKLRDVTKPSSDDYGPIMLKELDNIK